jgi:hypothetical protein
MGTLSETVNVINRLSFADLGKKTSVLRLQKTNEILPFRSPFAANKRKVLFSISSIFRIYMYIYINCMYILN